MMNRKNFSIYFVWLAIISLALCQFIRVEPSIVWSSETFVGVFIALMGIAVAVVIGYQAVSANEVKQDLKEQKNENEKLREEIEKFRRNIESMINESESKVNSNIESMSSKILLLEKHSDLILVSSQESVAILNALIIENTKNLMQRYPLDDFAKMHEALLYSLSYDSNNIDFIFHKLRQYGSAINTHTFGSGFTITQKGLLYCHEPYLNKTLKTVVEEVFLPPIKEVEQKIKDHERFSSISHDYKVLMKQFYERISICVSRLYPKDASETDQAFV